jgi:hypothetical protein
MPENVVNSDQSEEAALVKGEIVGVERTRIRVRLDSGTIGFMPLGDVKDGRIEVGRQARFRIVATDPGGSPSLAFAETTEAPAADEPFDRDVVRLHNALANHRPSNSVRSVERLTLGEEQIQNWIERAESGLGRLRKNRAKRANEEFYNGS